jgi:uncharacterized protein YndB with AHSA1/START domain
MTTTTTTPTGTVDRGKERKMSSEYHRSFYVGVPVARAWQAFADPRERENYVTPPGLRGDGWEAGKLDSVVEGRPPTDIEIGAVEPLRLINYREGVRFRANEGDNSVTDWLDVTVTFEAEGSGTRITFTRSGFGDSEEWQLFRQSQSLGQDETLSDLIVYLETGVAVHTQRHYSSWHGCIGAGVLEVGGGVEVRLVVPGGFAEHAGMRAGDLLVRLGGASVYRRSDVHAVERLLGPGATVQVTWIRDGELRTGEAALSDADYTVRHGVRGQ